MNTFLQNIDEEPTIIIVDDNPDNLTVALQCLESFDEYCDIICFKEPLKALEFVKKNKIDLAILDVGMPVLNGYDLCLAIKKIPYLKDVPVIFQTAATQIDDILKGFEAGGVDYIHKPLIKEVFKARVKTHLDLYIKSKYILKIANYDGLTDLLNRRSLNEYIQGLIDEGNCKASVIMMDIDHFKLYNDTYGHLLGDEVLKQVANVIKKPTEKRGYICARYGGEEFVCVLKNASLEEAIELAEDIQKGLKKKNIEHKATKIIEDGINLARISLSMGIANCDLSNIRIEDFLNLADEKLYVSKETGRNKYSY